MEAADGIRGAFPASLLRGSPSPGHPRRPEGLAAVPITTTDARRAGRRLPDDLQLVAGALCAVAAGQVNGRDVGGGVGVRVLVEGVVSVRWAVRSQRSCSPRLDSTGGKERCVADHRLGIGATGSRAAGLVGQVAL